MEHPILQEITKIRGKTMKRYGVVEGYHYVQLVSFNGKFTYRAEIPMFKLSKSFANPREAALLVDFTFVEHGKEPPNKLIKSKKFL
jgi:hypothetical protein